MRVLVVIFALLGMVGTGFFGFVMQTVFDETEGKSSAQTVLANIDEGIKEINANPGLVPNKDEAVAGFESARSAIQRATSLPIVFYGAAGLGFLLMLLSVLKVGPKLVHGVGLLVTGIVPLGFMMSIFSALGKFQDFWLQVEPTAPPALTAEQLQNGQLFILACCGGFLLSGLCAFFVKRD